MPLPTPFHTRMAACCESGEWNNWSGYLAATLYEPNHDREYYAIRNAAAVIDVSPLHKYDIKGPQAQQLVDRIMTRNIGNCQVGQVCYSPWCDEQGKIIDDGTVARLAADHFRITAADPSLRWFQDLGYGLQAEVSDISTALAALAVQGPNSRAVLANSLDGIDFRALRYFRLAHGTLRGEPVMVTRTGYTGDLGYEVWLAAAHAEMLWDTVFQVGAGYGLLPVGTAALDIARIEAGLLLIDVDYIPAPRALTEVQKSSPFDAGLGWAVSFRGGDYVGRRALAAEHEQGPRWALVGLRFDWDPLERLFAKQDLPPLLAGRARRDPVPVYHHGRQIGQATSRTFSPILKQYIALATLPARHAGIGTEVEVEVTVEHRRQRSPATVVAMPFYDPAHKRG